MMMNRSPQPITTIEIGHEANDVAWDAYDVNSISYFDDVPATAAWMRLQEPILLTESINEEEPNESGDCDCPMCR